MTVQNILITGISGSVGHYLFDVLAGDPRYHLYLVIRNPKKLCRDLSNYPNITLLQMDMRDVPQQKELLQKMDYVIWLATCWGGFREPWRVNVYPLFRMLRRLDRQRVKKIIYFSTASILDREHRPVEAIREIGTNYIRSKFLAHKMLQRNPLKEKIITVFPTWVCGGDATHPLSHAAASLSKLQKYISVLKYFTADFRFNFIHCADIARLTKHLMENPADKKEYVFGNDPLDVGELLRRAADFYGQKTPFQIKIPLGVLRTIAWLTKQHSWGKYCLRYHDFTYETINCKKAGLPSETDTVAGVLASLNKGA